MLPVSMLVLPLELIQLIQAPYLERLVAVGRFVMAAILVMLGTAVLVFQQQKLDVMARALQIVIVILD